jgi:predicted Na+-dependent transporter
VASSKQIAGLVGPTLVVMLISEAPLVQPHLYDTQIPPVVYLSGLLMFVAGLAVVRVHNHWPRNWTVLVTLTAWFFLILGLIRMFAASQYRQVAASTTSEVFMVFEGVLLVFALVITYHGYRRPSQ